MMANLILVPSSAISRMRASKDDKKTTILRVIILKKFYPNIIFPQETHPLLLFLVYKTPLCASGYYSKVLQINYLINFTKQ